MSVSLGKVVTQVNSKITTGGQDAINTARLVGSVEALETRYSVANTAVLPAAADNTGRFIYVEDIAAYRYSDGTQWTNDYDTTLTVLSRELYTWGNNFDGQLGDGTFTTRTSPVREFCSATDWCTLSLGFSRTAAIKIDGQLWTWGNNFCGALGDGTATAKRSPVREFCSATDWCGVSAGGGHTMAIKTTGQIWAWGCNPVGQLGDGFVTTRLSPVREVCSATDWCQVSAGQCHTTAVKTSGELWAWGRNIGRLGDGTSVDTCSPVREFCSATDWCGVSAGYLHTSALKTSGQLWVWGSGGCGRLGDGTLNSSYSPIREFCSATDWCRVSSGCTHTIAIKTSGQIWVWGSNYCGRLGDGTLTGSCSPVREFCSATDWCGINASCSHTAAIKTSGQIWAWGNNLCGRLGDGTTTTRCSPVREFSSTSDWGQVSTKNNHTGAIKLLTKGFNEP